jgi:hypothetical protein
MRQPFECAYQLIDHIAQAIFDSLDDWLLRTLIVFTHAVRLTSV